MFCFYLYVLILSGSFLKAQTCNSDISNPNAYGSGSWIGHVYDHNGSGNPVTTPFATYKGYTTQAEIFDQVWGTGKPSCAAGNDNFAVRYRMNKTFNPGNYTFTIGADDGVRLSIDGGNTWILSDWSDHGYQTTSVRVPLSGNYNLVLEYYEKGGDARVSFNYTTVSTTDYNMPSMNTTSIITACTGSLYDSGGSTTGYSNSEDRSVIIKPGIAGNLVQVSGSIIAENGFDYLTIYDGEGTTGTVLWGGKAHGTGNSCGTFTVPVVMSSSGSLTVRFRSNGSNVCVGFNLSLSCNSTTACTGTPTGGIAVLTPATGAPSSAFVATVTGGSTGSGLSYQWQIANSSGGPWTDISGATGTIANLTAISLQGAVKYYRRKITCTNGGAIAYSPYQTFTTSSPVYCSPTASNPNGLYINSFKFVGTLNDQPANITVANGTGYADFTALTPTEQPDGSVMNVVASALGTQLTGKWKAWVDWNGDGDFDDAGEQVYSMTKYTTEALTFGFIIPTGQAPGKYRFRIRASKGAATNFGPCTNFSDGDTEDYSFIVKYNCPATVTAINTDTVLHGHRCGSGSVMLSAAGNGVSYNWYDSPTSITPVATGSTYYTPSISATTIYYVTAVSSGGCESAYHTPVPARIDPSPVVTLSSAPSICGAETSSFLITGSGDKFEDIILNEKFDSGTGTFSKSTSGTGYYTGVAGNWQNRPSPFIPPTTATPPTDPYEGLAPALQSGYFGGNYAAIVTDINRSTPILNYLTLTNSIDINGFQNLKLDYDLYYFSVTNREKYGYVKVEYSKDNGGTWITLRTITTEQGNPSNWAKLSETIPGPFNTAQFKIRFVLYSAFLDSADTTVTPNEPPGWKESIAAVDNVRIYGDKPLTTPFKWSGAPGIFYQADCTSALGSGASNTVCVKPSASQIESDISWNLTASASFSNGCPATASVVITNNSKVYNTTTSTDWNIAANWKPDNLVPDATKCVIIKKPVFLSTGDGSAKNVTIEPGGTLTINKDRTLIVTDYIKNNTTVDNAKNFVVESDGNVIQFNNGAANSGNMTAKREVKNLRYIPGTAVDYVYWSSPVSGQTTKGPGGFSPNTPNNTFFYYRESNDRFYETGDPTFTPGRGYAVRAEGVGTTPTTYTKTYEFKGTPNNGNISYPIIKSADNPTGVVHGYNLVGNPYPSNIDFNELYLGNLNGDLIYNTAWFWTNNIYTPSQMGSNYGGNNYAIFNGTGGVGATAPYTGGLTPNGIIKVGQAFIVQKKEPGTAPLEFRNTYGDEHDLRKTGTESIFFQKNNSGKNKFWISLIGPAQMVNSQLIGYVSGATNGYEQDFDAEAFDDYSDLFYSVLEGKKLVIQGKSDAFTVEDRVPLGANFYQNGAYTISLDNTEGIFNTGQTIYLKDKQAGITANLSEGSYTFQATKGLSNGRFEIVYQPEIVLVTDSKVKNGVEVYRDSGDFVVKAQNKKITAIQVFDASGRLVYSVSPNSLQTVIPAGKLLNSMYVLKIDQGGIITTRKIIK
ncbi:MULTISPECIES: GEVED domain-containing protein [unclassified Kaistella]|uniref:GEVED domain-containing protein n=1 Tax=unclassified Kaistella TaxID=2762626 RepID=UPI002737086F|nr:MULTISPECIES: GEVED domain-containing protein [unclassified Kaistella]MDP2453802.1 GEVED domain-containing protein [Kaistella sp. SH11-4b]MDP2456859.1 GEVED domain-containing protein [Kaistella sp. SH40-3]MDP2459615.1 GEVED domain-containing protein [Kaistella sp. SH19-2b]